MHFSSRSQVQGSTFRVKDKKVIEDPKSLLKMLIFQVLANLAPNCGLGLTKMTLFSQIWIPNAVRGREWNLEPLNL